jgi:hypothetical protein
MNYKRTSLLLMAILVTFVGVSAARADLPADRTIELQIREDPTDNESPVTFLVTVDITAIDSEDNMVAWEIKGAHFIDRQCEQRPCDKWTGPDPIVDTIDGLWWVEHVDPQSPQTEEFDSMPLIMGTAGAQGSYADLNYEVQGRSYSGAPSYGGKVTSLTYELVKKGMDEPEEEGDDEPTELDEENHP